MVDLELESLARKTGVCIIAYFSNVFATRLIIKLFRMYVAPLRIYRFFVCDILTPEVLLCIVCTWIEKPWAEKEEEEEDGTNSRHLAPATSKGFLHFFRLVLPFAPFAPPIPPS